MLRDVETRKTHLEDDSALEHHQHEGREQAVVPIFIQAPERDTKYLEHEERRGGMLSEQLCERRNRDIEFVQTIEGRQARDDLRSERGRGEEVPERRTT